MCAPATMLNRERAIRRAWSDLRDLGADQVSAFCTCTMVYLIRHPGASLHEARDQVAACLDQSRSDP
jgi:hypothetical protein